MSATLINKQRPAKPPGEMPVSSDSLYKTHAIALLKVRTQSANW